MRNFAGWEDDGWRRSTRAVANSTELWFAMFNRWLIRHRHPRQHGERPTFLQHVRTTNILTAKSAMALFKLAVRHRWFLEAPRIPDMPGRDDRSDVRENAHRISLKDSRLFRPQRHHQEMTGSAAAKPSSADAKAGAAAVISIRVTNVSRASIPIIHQASRADIGLSLKVPLGCSGVFAGPEVRLLSLAAFRKRRRQLGRFPGQIAGYWSQIELDIGNTSRIACCLTTGVVNTPKQGAGLSR